MASSLKLVQESKSGATVGFLGFGLRSGAVESPRQSVHDGDTVIGRTLANVDVRFLGMDTPEVSFHLPGQRAFVSIGSEKWAAFLSNPFEDWTGPEVPQELLQHLQPGLTEETADNHARHAAAARQHLIELVEADMATFHDGSKDQFSFFIRFAHDVIDRYGRLLGYLNVNLEADVQDRPDTYNERMLQAGLAMPYFIWPNTEPFKKQPTLLDAVFAPSDVAGIASSGALGRARGWVAEARAAGKGLFDPTDPLLLQPFELRYLADRRLPDRAVVDLSGANPGLVPATGYGKVPHEEDRLFIPSEFVPLFRERGWQ
jgi:endonuclease YncB( thermonuclease family)